MRILARAVVAGQQRVRRDTKDPVSRAVEVDVAAKGPAQGKLVVIEGSWTAGTRRVATQIGIEVAICAAHKRVGDECDVLVVRPEILHAAQKHVLRYEEAVEAVGVGCCSAGAKIAAAARF